MKKVLLLSIVINFEVNYIFAQQQVSSMEALNAAIHTFYSKSEILKVSDNAKVKAIHNFQNGRGDTLMYEVVFQNNVGVLLSGSKACLPVLGYYTKPKHDNGSIFDTNNENIPCCFKELLREYAQEIDSCFAEKTRILHYATQWHELQEIDTTKINKSAGVGVEPLLKTEWGQNRPNNGMECPAYNYYVTQTSNRCKTCNNHCSVGCVAVAMGQIMKYWNYPVYMPNKTYQYDWCNMLDTLTYLFPPNYNDVNPNYEKERNAIARLLKDCADAAKMNYCSSGCTSTSTVYKARQAFVNDFDYSSDADHQWKTSYNINTWKGRIKNNLNNGWPVLYGGYDPSPPTGHSFVLDGHDGGDYFHVNWGYNGSQGYFTLNNLTYGNNTYSTQSACFYIYPEPNYDPNTYCNFTFSLLEHFEAGNTQEDVPKTFAVLESVPAVVNGVTTQTAWRTIEAGQTVEYVAHKEIRLTDGFRAEAGSYFHAYIDPCPSCISAKVAVKRSENGEEIEEELYIAVGDEDEEQPLNKAKTMGDTGEPQVYPNPTTGLLTIHSQNSNNPIQMIELYDTQGAKQFTFNGNNGYFQEIDISHLPPQVYVLKIQVNGQIFTKKLILQK